MLSREPKDDAQLFDMLHSLFGIGDYDDSQGAWFEFRMREISKLKAIRRRRQILIGSMAMAARYCFNNDIPIAESYQVVQHIDEARRDARRRAVPELTAEVARAVQMERRRQGSDSSQWIDRLLRARGPFRREVLDEWAQAQTHVDGHHG